MTILMSLLALFDAAVLPVKGHLSSLIFVIIVGVGIWRIRNYKSWFIMSLFFITLAASFYLIGGRTVDETVVHKLSDWSLNFLLLGALQLARLKKNDK